MPPTSGSPRGAPAADGTLLLIHNPEGVTRGTPTGNMAQIRPLPIEIISKLPRSSEAHNLKVTQFPLLPESAGFRQPGAMGTEQRGGLPERPQLRAKRQGPRQAPWLHT